MAEKRSARRAGRAASGDTLARQRNGQKAYHSPRINQQPGEVAVYNDLQFAGSILQQRGEYIAFDQHGHQLGSFDRERGASSALYMATRPGRAP
jgi:hypothetical protein